jgi:hypothetical protein
MAKIDRRKGGDRRKHDRHHVAIEVEWENAKGKRTGTVNDISMSGCFLLSGGEVDDGEAVRIHFPTIDGKKVPVSGDIVNHVFEVGFAIKFIDLSDSQIVFLHRLIDQLASGT